MFDLGDLQPCPASLNAGVASAEGLCPDGLLQLDVQGDWSASRLPLLGTITWLRPWWLPDPDLHLFLACAPQTCVICQADLPATPHSCSAASLVVAPLADSSAPVVALQLGRASLYLCRTLSHLSSSALQLGNAG